MFIALNSVVNRSECQNKQNTLFFPFPSLIVSTIESESLFALIFKKQSSNCYRILVTNPLNCQKILPIRNKITKNRRKSLKILGNVFRKSLCTQNVWFICPSETTEDDFTPHMLVTLRPQISLSLEFPICSPW